MLPLQHARHWRIASVLLLVSVLTAMLMPVAWLFGSKASGLSWFAHIDKWLHGLVFLVLALWFAGQYRPHSYWLVGAGLMLFGCFVELCQLMVGYRTADWIDIGANTAGIIVGLAVALTGLGGWCLRVEAWYLARNAGPQNRSI